jgi:hypothetical protein
MMGLFLCTHISTSATSEQVTYSALHLRYPPTLLAQRQRGVR